MSGWVFLTDADLEDCDERCGCDLCQRILSEGVSEYGPSNARVIVKLSGGYVIGVDAPKDMRVEVRQFHRDYHTDEIKFEHRAVAYSPVWPPREKDESDG